MSKVLVCDDNESILDVLEAVLLEFGYEVLICADGTLVRGMVIANNPDIVMLDVWMPKADGRVVLKEIKQERDIPVILISALNDLPQIAEQSGADGYLEKPFEISNVIAIIEEHLHKNLLTEPI